MPRVDPAVPVRSPESPRRISFPSQLPRGGDPGAALANLGLAFLERQRRINRDEAILSAAEATEGLETEILADPDVDLADAADVFSQRIEERHAEILEELSPLGRNEAERALRANAATRTARFRREAFNRQADEIRRQIDAKELSRIQSFAAAETDEARSLIASAHEQDLANAVDLGAVLPAEAQLRTETFRRAGTKLAVDSLAAQGRFEEAEELIARTPGLTDAEQAILFERVDRAEDSELTREYTLQQRREQQERRQQTLNYRDLVARLADEDPLNDPNDTELLELESLGSISPQGRAELIRLRDSSGSGSPDDLPALNLAYDIEMGRISGRQALPLINDLPGATRAEKLRLTSIAVARETDFESRPDLREALEQYDALYQPIEDLLATAGPEAVASIQGARLSGLADLRRVILQSTSELNGDEIRTRVRAAFSRSVPDPGYLPQILPERFGALLPTTPDQQGNPIPLTRPRDLADVALFEALIDRAADPRQPEPLLTMAEAARRLEDLDLYRSVFELRDTAERLATPLPELPKPPPPATVEQGPTPELLGQPSEPLAAPGSALERLIRSRLGRRAFPAPFETPQETP